MVTDRRKRSTTLNFWALLGEIFFFHTGVQLGENKKVLTPEYNCDCQKWTHLVSFQVIKRMSIENKG